MKLFSLPAASALAVCTLSLGAQANTNNNEPGSLLVFPIFENEPESITQVTVTNINPDVLTGTVKVEFVYINGDTCFEFNKTRTLTANDEITVITKFDNPGMEDGYLYVFAKHVSSGKAIKFDWLIGTSLLIESEEGSFEIGPIVFNAGSRIGPGGETDVDQDGIRDLNGFEYEQAPDELYVPRFHGQISNVVETDLVLINLTGGSQFQAIVDFLVFNDNEEAFSAQHQFRCWDEITLSEISGAFDNSFLLSTNHAVGETSGLVADVPGTDIPIETGWFRIDGNVAFSTQASFPDPAILAARIELISDEPNDGSALDDIAAAALPFSLGSQSNGDLVPHSIFGDNN